MSETIEDYTLEILALEKEKKNFARRINYKIKKLRAKIEERANGYADAARETPPDTDPVPPPKATPGLDDLESAPQEAKPAATNTFEIGYDESNDYDIFFNNVWHPIGFSTLKQGDIFRVRRGETVLKFYDNKFLTPVSYPTRNEHNQMVIRVEVFIPDEQPDQSS